MNFALIFKLFLETIVGFFIGIAIGLTGVGGGVLVLPALIHILGIAPISAVGTGLAYAVITKLGGTVYHFKLKTIRIRRSFYFLVGSIPSVLISSKMIHYFVKKHGVEFINERLQVYIGIILLTTAIIMFLQMFSVNDKERINHILESKILHIPFHKKMLAILAGAIVGILFGITSIGGGVFIIPFFMLYFDSSCKQAVGTSIFISVIISALGGIVYLTHGNVEILPAILLCVGSLPGVRLGSRLTERIPEQILITIVIIMIILSGMSMLFFR